MASDSPNAPHFVLLGGGIMGLTSAFYLLTSPRLPRGSRVTLVENSQAGIAPAASSFAAGFLAGGADVWHAPPSVDLARLSWKCHVALAEELGGREKWGFRECGSVGLRVGGGDEKKSAYRLLPGGRKEIVEKDWLEGEREDLTGAGGMGQVDPALFCRALHARCTSVGLETIFGDPISLSPASSLTSLRTLSIVPHYTTTPILISTSSILVAAGPWSAALCARLSLPEISLTNLPGHSIILKPSPTSTPLPAEAVFAGISGGAIGVHASTSGHARSLTVAELNEGYTRSPELFTRANGLVYVAGENSIPATTSNWNEGGGLPNKLPATADGVEALLDDNLVKRLLNAAGAVSPLLRLENGAKLERAKFCYRPITSDGEPMLGELEPGVFIATGHGPWGITLAPGTGKVVSELMLGEELLSADISGLSPSRFSGLSPIRPKL